MSEVVYRSRVRIVRERGPVRTALIDGEPRPVTFSVHGGIAAYYKVDPASLGEPHAATIDYAIAATAS